MKTVIFKAFVSKISKVYGMMTFLDIAIKLRDRSLNLCDSIFNEILKILEIYTVSSHTGSIEMQCEYNGIFESKEIYETITRIETGVISQGGLKFSFAVPLYGLYVVW